MIRNDENYKRKSVHHVVEEWCHKVLWLWKGCFSTAGGVNLQHPAVGNGGLLIIAGLPF